MILATLTAFLNPVILLLLVRVGAWCWPVRSAWSLHNPNHQCILTVVKHFAERSACGVCYTVVLGQGTLHHKEVGSARKKKQQKHGAEHAEN